MAPVLLTVGVLWELHEVTREDHSEWHLACCKRYGRLCRFLGLTAYAPRFSPLGRESSWGMLARATLTDKLQSSSKAQCSSKGQHTFWINEEDPGVLADMPVGVRHVTYLLCVL